MTAWFHQNSQSHSELGGWTHWTLKHVWSGGFLSSDFRKTVQKRKMESDGDPQICQQTVFVEARFSRKSSKSETANRRHCGYSGPLNSETIRGWSLQDLWSSVSQRSIKFERIKQWRESLVSNLWGCRSLPASGWRRCHVSVIRDQKENSLFLIPNHQQNLQNPLCSVLPSAWNLLSSGPIRQTEMISGLHLHEAEISWHEQSLDIVHRSKFNVWICFCIMEAVEVWAPKTTEPEPEQNSEPFMLILQTKETINWPTRTTENRKFRKSCF